LPRAMSGMREKFEPGNLPVSGEQAGPSARGFAEFSGPLIH
jgi:hypothetical protein